MDISAVTEALEARLKLHNRAMAATSCGITIADARQPDMPLIYVNDAFMRMTGYDESETLGRNCRFLQGDDRQQPGLVVIRAAMQQHRDCTVMLRNYRKDGTLFWNEFYASPVRDESGLVTHYVGIQTDATARVEAQEALKQMLVQLRETQTMLVHSEKMNALGQMVAGIAHEINNPVSFVNSNLYSLRGALESVFGAYNTLKDLALANADDTAQRQIAQVHADADIEFWASDLEDVLRASIDGLGRVKRIVESLRTFSRLDEAEFKRVDLRENVDSTLLIARAALGSAEVVLDIPPELPPLACYPAELNQVFLNIMLNAAQAMPGGGRLTIRARDQGETVSIAFTDTGTGMTPEVQAHVFDPFFTTKPVGEGTGLGMAIAYRIMTSQHRGQIEVVSELGTGTTFTLRLPKELRP